MTSNLLQTAATIAPCRPYCLCLMVGMTACSMAS